MRIKSKLIVAGAITFIFIAQIPAYSNDGNFDFQLRSNYKRPLIDLRGPLDHDHLSLKRELENASNWGLRSHRNARLRASLLLASRPYYETSQLRSFLHLAINNSASLRSTLHEANASHHRSRAALFDLLPTLSFTAEIGKEGRSGSTNNPSYTSKNRQARVALDWTVYSSGAKWGAVQSARWGAIASDLQFLAIERQTFLEKVTIYVELSTRKKLVNEIRNTKLRLHKIRENVRGQYSAGLTSRTDIAQVDAEIAAVEIELESAKYAFEQQKVAYFNATGVNAPHNMAFPNVGHLVPTSKRDAISRALNRNFSLHSAYATANSAAANSRAVRGSFLPRVSLYASASIANNTNSQNSSNDGRSWATGVRLTVPLVDLSSMSGYQESRQQALAATYRSRDVHHLLIRDVETSWLEYQSLKKQRGSLARQESAIERALNGLRKELRAGLRPASDILREEIELTNVRVDKINLELRKAIVAYRLAAQFSDLSLTELSPI